MSSFLPNFLYSQLLVTPPLQTHSFKEKTVIVTGANTGLGLEAARSFVQLGAKTVILAVRNLGKGDTARKDIENTTKCESSTVQVWHLDMSYYGSVQEFAKRADSELDRIDAVVANAGIQVQDFVIEMDNESTITVNVVSTFLLIVLLLPALRKSAQKYGIRPTATIVGSDTHLMANFSERKAGKGKIFDALRNEETSSMSDRYATSKLLQVLCVRALASRLTSEPSITINFVNPGLCRSNMTNKSDTYRSRIILGLLARTTETGARSLVAGAVAGPESHGEYLDNCVVTAPAKMVVYDERNELQEAVWEELCTRLESISPGITRKTQT